MQLLKEQLLELEARATRQTVSIAQVPKGRSNHADAVGEYAVEMVSVQEKIDCLTATMYGLMAKIIRAIGYLPHREAYLMVARYVSFLPWSQIARDMGYSLRRTHDIHSEALQMLRSCVTNQKIFLSP